MFLLDTNILSALMGPVPAPEVTTWVAAQSRRTLFTAAVCQAEILACIAVLPEGRRRLGLEAAARAMFEDDFEGRVLPFDAAAAVAYAEIFAVRTRAGRPVAPLDLTIAAVAHAKGAGMVTRNTSDFSGCGLTLINPWEDT